MKVGDGANDRDRDRLAVPRGIKGVKWPGSAEGQTFVTTPNNARGVRLAHNDSSGRSEEREDHSKRGLGGRKIFQDPKHDRRFSDFDVRFEDRRV